MIALVRERSSHSISGPRNNMKQQKGIAQEPTIFLSKKLWAFAHNMRGHIALYCTLFIISNCLLLLTPYIFGVLIAEIQNNGVSYQNIHYFSLLLFALFLKEVLFWAFHGPARIVERMVAYSAAINYRHYLLNGLLDLGLAWHSEHDSGDTIDKVTKAGDAILDFGENVFQIFQILVKLIGTTLVLIWFSLWIGGFVFIFVIISFFVIFQFDKRLLPQYRGLNKLSNRAIAAVFDSLSNVTTVKILHIEAPVLSGVIARFKESLHLYKKNSTLNEWKWFTGNMIFQFIGLAPLFAYLYYGLSHNIPIDAGKISTLYLYLSELVFVYWGFGTFYEQLGILKNRMLNAEPIERAFLTQRKRSRRPIGDWKELAINDLFFSYSNNEEYPDLHNISFQFKRGERIALIGESGSGKTTFLKVLHGMYPTARSSLNFADIDLKTMLVPQEPEIFSSTIRENITLGIDRSEQQVMRAVRMAAFDSVLAQLPKGLNSVVNEKGVNLSGGQKQRLALARALLFCHEKDIILLDESTSSVDPENELEIYRNIWAAFPDKTIIASIHKLNLLKLFDRIVIFEGGTITRQGTFDHLVKHDAAFRNAWESFVVTNN